MPLPEGKELERRYRALFDNEAIQEVVDARTPNDASPVDEDAVLDFVKSSEAAHAAYLTTVFRLLDKD